MHIHTQHAPILFYVRFVPIMLPIVSQVDKQFIINSYFFFTYSGAVVIEEYAINIIHENS